MTYHAANILFDMMDAARKERVLELFESIRRENILGVRDAFAAAVEDECKAIKTETVEDRGTPA